MRPRPPLRMRARAAAALAWAGAATLGATQLAAQSPPAPPVEEKSAVELADSLMEAGEMEASYTVLVARLGLVPDDWEARWRATRGALGLGIAGETHEIRRTWLREADAQGRELLLLRPDDPEALAWAAAARGRRALGEDGNRTVANLAREAWLLTGRLLEMQPDHPLGNHVRGKIHQQVARLPAVKRLVARMFLGNDLVGQAKWELAEEHLRRAIAADPGMVLFYLDLGETYRYQGKRQAAVDTYTAGLAVPDRLPLDQRFKSTMRTRLAGLQGGPATP